MKPARTITVKVAENGAVEVGCDPPAAGWNVIAGDLHNALEVLKIGAYKAELASAVKDTLETERVRRIVEGR
jgi:hypothetical protein